MNWLDKTPIDLFNNIPEEILENLVINKQQNNKKLLEFNNSSKDEIIIQLMSRHILSKHSLPNFIINNEKLIRWLFCLYVIE